MIPALRRFARRTIDLSERLLHPLRRRRARARLGEGTPGSILLVCLGNICRSPYAAHRLRQQLDGRGPETASAGFIRPGRSSPELARRVAARRGVDLDDHRSRVVSRELLDDADIVFVMSARQRRSVVRDFGLSGADVLVLGDLDPGPIDRRTIDDPYDCPESVFDAVFDRIDRCCRSLAAAIR